MTSDSPAASAAAEQVASVLQAAEQAAAQLRLEAEERLRSRIAEGDRAAELRVSAAEEEATEILAAARDEAKRIVSEASSKGLEVIGRAQSEADRLRAEAAKGHDEASWRAQDLMRAAEQTAAEIDIEGMQIVRDLRELGDSLRATPSAYSGTCRRSTPGCWVRSSASQLALHERSGGGRAPRAWRIPTLLGRPSLRARGPEPGRLLPRRRRARRAELLPTGQGLRPRCSVRATCEHAFVDSTNVKGAVAERGDPPRGNETERAGVEAGRRARAHRSRP